MVDSWESALSSGPMNLSVELDFSFVVVYGEEFSVGNLFGIDC